MADRVLEVSLLGLLKGRPGSCEPVGVLWPGHKTKGSAGRGGMHIAMALVEGLLGVGRVEASVLDVIWLIS